MYLNSILKFSIAYLILFVSPFFAIGITQEADGTVTVQATAPTDNDFLSTYSYNILTKQAPIINLTGTGSFYGASNNVLKGFILNAKDSQTIRQEGKESITFHIDTTRISNQNGAMFFVGNKNSSITFDTNLFIDFTTGSNIGLGVFLSDKYNATDPQGNDQTGSFTFNKSLIVDASNVDQTNGGYIFNLNQKKAQMSINSTSGNISNKANIIQLQGNFHLNGSDAILNINLSNQNSYLVGKEDYESGNFNLGLSEGGKWIVTNGNVVINTLAISNVSDPTNHPSLQSTALNGALSYLDIATQRFNQPYAQRTIKINTLAAGNRGVFRTIVDIPNNTGDLITIQNDASGTHYLQIFQKTADLNNIPQNAEIKVAEVINGGENLTFNPLPARIGIYNYTANISKEVQNNGYKWVLRADKTQVDDKPDEEITDAIYRLMTLQYRIYRIQTESINKHIDELVYTTTHHNFWGNYFIGSQSYKSSKDNYQTFQGGYDYGWNFGKLRQFAGGFFDFTKMKDFDTDYDGSVDNIGFGGYYQTDYYASKKTTLNFDAKIKYNYSSNKFTPKNNLAGANFVESYHLFFLGARLGSKIGLDKKNLWFLEPSGNAGIGFMSGGFINIIDQVTQQNFGGTQDSASIVSLDANLAVGKRFQNAQNYLDIKGGMSYAYNNNTGGDLTFIDVNTANNFTVATQADHRMGIFFGINASFNNILKLYGNFSRSFFSNFNTTYLVSFGLRLSFQDFSFSSSNKSRVKIENTSKRKDNQDTVERKRPKRILQGGNARPLPRLYSD